MNARMLIMLVACGLVFGGIFGFKWFGNRMMNQFFDSAPLPTVTVSSATAFEAAWSQSLSAVGTVRAVKGTDVTTESSGIVDSIQFESGDLVEAGAIVVTLDRSTDLAELAAQEAQAELARQELARARSLFDSRAVSQSELDSRAAAAAAAEANVAAQRARIARKVIRAPFRGELGIRRIDLGQHISPGTPIVSLQSLDPIYVNFKMPQQMLGQLRRGLSVAIHVDELDRKVMHGEITAIEPAVDISTRNFEAQATLANPDRMLRPGMFAQVEVNLGRSESVIVVPQTAVSFNPYGDSVWVITGGDGDRTAERRVVKTGERRGDLVAVTGVAPGEEVASSGLLKLRNGASVNINNDIQPSAESFPQPPNS